MGLRIQSKVVKWGNGYGIRLTRGEFERLGVAPGTPVEADLVARPETLPMPLWNLGTRGTDLDELFAEGVLEEMEDADARPGH